MSCNAFCYKASITTQVGCSVSVHDLRCHLMPLSLPLSQLLMNEAKTKKKKNTQKWDLCERIQVQDT